MAYRTLRWNPCRLTNLTRLAVGTAVGLVGLGTGVALAASGGAATAILAQCNSGNVAGRFTVQQLEHALTIMSAYTRQYTSCPDVIQAAIATAQHHLGTATARGSVGAFLPAPLIAVLAVLVLVAAGLGALAMRRRFGV